ncbi:MAG: glycosyltransferase family 4 protein [Bacteroidota bacterium]
MKILQINNFPRLGGAEVLFQNSIELLERYGNQVVSFSSRINEKNIVTDYSIEKSKSLVSRAYSIEAKKKIEQIILLEKPDIAHFHNIIGSITFSILPVLKRNKIPIVATIHDYKLLCPTSNFYNARKNELCEKCKGGKFYNCVVDRCSTKGLLNSILLSSEGYFRNIFFPFHKIIDEFIFVSDFELKKFLEVYPYLISKSNLIYNFTNRFSYSENKGNYFLSFGRLAVEKGLLTLLETFRRLPSATLKIVGEGELKEVISNNKTHNVELIGFKFGKELEQIIKDAYFTIVPSECYETNSLTTVESYSFGKPVIGTNLGALSELIINGITGFTFKRKNIDELAEIINTCLRMGNEQYFHYSKNAFKFANEKFSPDVHYTQLMEVYNKALLKN